MKRKRLIPVIFGILIIIPTLAVGYVLYTNPYTVTATNDSALPFISAEALKAYDGTNPTLPIYVGLDGYVYDVTPGKAYYIVGGTYHSIAGKDASAALHIFGGDIIKEKYQIVGTFKPH